MSRRRQALFRVGEDDENLLARYAEKPFKKIIDAGALFNVLKESLHRYARSLEYPGPPQSVPGLARQPDSYSNQTWVER